MKNSRKEYSLEYDHRNDWREALLDQALEETFPASDPISPMCPLSNLDVSWRGRQDSTPLRPDGRLNRP